MSVGAVNVIGGGLAGSEAAWQLGKRGISARLYEMRPCRPTEAHRTGLLAELVCSNSFRSRSVSAAVGLLKEELRLLGSLIMEVADECQVPAGMALAVDREAFATAVGERLGGLETVQVIREEVRDIPPGLTIVATGPLTSEALSERLRDLVGAHELYFYDAISPIVTAESIDMKVAFRSSRYGKGQDDYINLPLGEEEYEHFLDALLAAEKVPAKSFEKFKVFEGCMPIEEMAGRGRESLLFGPMKPVGLVDPRTKRRPHAVVQLRQDNREGTLYSMVGFQTKMTHAEQKRVFAMIPGLEQACFVRLGSLHRNTFINAPQLLDATLRLRGNSELFFAGQIVGVEGYVESAAAGLLAGLNVARLARGGEPATPPPTTALGSLLSYISDPTRRNFQPMNANYGLFPPLPVMRGLFGREKKLKLAERALRDMSAWAGSVGALEPMSRPNEARVS